jgi:IclR family mhp operon transcriptional activator
MHINRSLGRGLKMLAILNAGGEHRVASLARALQLPRSTAFRLLCTLVSEGFVWRDPATDCYHPTAMVLGLSDGFDATARLVQVAKPLVSELGRQLIWPVTLATLSGTSVLLRQTTDASSPLALVRYSPGHRAPLLEEAPGLVLLAYSAAEHRQMVLDLLYSEESALPRISRAEIEARMVQIRALGFACLHRPGPDRSSLAVPVRAGNDTLAALVVRFARSAVRQQIIMDRFLPALRGTALGIIERFHSSSGQSAVRVSGRPRREEAEA